MDFRSVGTTSLGGLEVLQDFGIIWTCGLQVLGIFYMNLVGLLVIVDYRSTVYAYVDYRFIWTGTLSITSLDFGL